MWWSKKGAEEPGADRGWEACGEYARRLEHEVCVRDRVIARCRAALNNGSLSELADALRDA